jgi:hypothetical protein
MTFTHSSLGSNQLRLLKPVTANHQNISFKVLKVSRQSALQYTAVSYTWGDADPTEVIYLDGKAFPVRPNLWSCLYYLSLEAGHVRSIYIWVDAICIDQTNDEERTAQVRLMDAIYRDAAFVSVWLGLVPAADQFMHGSRAPIKTFDQDPFDWDDEMFSLAVRPYWSRFWVIQEFLLNQTVVVYCSGNVIDWSFFQDILGRKAGVEMLSDRSYDAIRSAPTHLQSALSLLVGRHPDRHPDMLLPLHELLIRHRGSQCKDPRDRVFSLLGLVTAEERGFLQRAFPDYALSHDVVVVIAIGHVKLFSIGETIDFDLLFLGLGVDSKERTKKLLRVAEDFDYIDIDAQSARRMAEEMEFNDELEAMGNENMYDSAGYEGFEGTRNRSSCGKCRLLMMVIALFIIGVVFFKIARKI